MFTAIMRDSYRCLEYRVPLLVLLMVVASLLEGVGLTMLLPLLARFGLSTGVDAGTGGATQANALTDTIDRVLAALSIPAELGPLLAVIVCVLVLQVFATFAKSWFQTRCATRYTADWRGRLFDAVIAADWPYLLRTEASRQANIIVNETSRISAAFNLALQMINAALFMFVYAAIAIAAAWQMVAFLSVFGLGVYLVTRPLSRRSKKTGEDVTTVSERLMHHAHEFLVNAKLIKATATEAMAQSVMQRAVEDYRRTYVLAGLIPAVVMLIYMGLGYIILGVGVWAALTYATIDAAAIIVSIYVFLRLYVQLSNFQQMRQSFALAAPALTSTQKEFEAALRAAEHRSDGVVLASTDPAHIATSHLSVSYGDHRALSDVTTDLAAGRIVGLTGASGAGKSTFVDAIVGLVPSVQGKVSIDGVPVPTLDLREWRHQIGYVAQETLLLQGTVAENIAWGARDTSRDAVQQAARLAHAHDFIEQLPKGYDTVIGGRSVRMSGGQRQRIGLARALHGNKRLLILDEATSALDSESEQQVLRAIDTLRGSVTVIMIAHRLSTLRLADQILVFDEGRIVESGAFEMLIRKDGSFKRLWEFQAMETNTAAALP
ncbi:MAG: ABC transporter ATP-binding protein/permease [Alphaproteobacteria bacterium]|nr:ABC transporter ATP-binding protein/permease [Alphaproteobacteria bacterium]